MQQVIRWIEEIALAESGSDLIDPTELDRRVEALRGLGRNWREMSGGQFSEAMSVSHFPLYFADAIDRAFRADYEYQRGDWPLYTTPDEAIDFRDVKRFRMSEPDTLTRRRELDQHVEGSISEEVQMYGVEEYSRAFDVSWRTILNDDLAKIAETPRRMARAAGRFEDQFVSALYHNSTTQAGLVGLGALYSTTAVLAKDSLATGINAMMQRQDVKGNPLQVGGISLVVGPTLVIAASEILQNLLAYGNPGSTTPGGGVGPSNNLVDYLSGIRVDPYIRDGGSGEQPWYLVANPGSIPTITVARLRGVPGPFTFRKDTDIVMLSGSAPSSFLLGSADTGDVVFYVETVIGGWDDATFGGVTDEQGIYYSDGST
jgi:hypothetical protein